MYPSITNPASRLHFAESYVYPTKGLILPATWAAIHAVISSFKNSLLFVNNETALGRKFTAARAANPPLITLVVIPAKVVINVVTPASLGGNEVTCVVITGS